MATPSLPLGGCSHWIRVTVRTSFLLAPRFSTSLTTSSAVFSVEAGMYLVSRNLRASMRSWVGQNRKEACLNQARSARRVVTWFEPWSNGMCGVVNTRLEGGPPSPTHAATTTRGWTACSSLACSLRLLDHLSSRAISSITRGRLSTAALASRKARRVRRASTSTAVQAYSCLAVRAKQSESCMWERVEGHADGNVACISKRPRHVERAIGSMPACKDDLGLEKRVLVGEALGELGTANLREGRRG